MGALSSIIAIAASLLVSVAYSQDTISFTHNSFPRDPFAVDLFYRGHAHVRSGTRFLRLTNTDSTGTVPRAQSAGRVVHRYTYKFWETDGRQRSFDTTFVFSITPSSRGAADGITFFIGRIPSDPAAGANMGIFDSNGIADQLFAVEFDTFPNPQWEMGSRHIGINLGSRTSNVSAPFDSGTGERVTARVQYDANTKVIRVSAVSGSQTATLSLAYDLKDLFTGQWVRFGLSSATGGVPAELGIHDIHSWTFSSTIPPKEFRINNDISNVIDDAISNILPSLHLINVTDALSTLPP